MGRSQISVDTLIGLAILGFAIAVLLVVVYPEIKTYLVGEGEKGVCEWSLVMHSIAKLGDWSLIPPECRAHRIEVNLDDLKHYEKEASKRIGVYKKDSDEYGPVLRFFNNPNDPNQLMEWALNKAVAVEMKDCWEKVFKGRLPLFDKWWRLYDWGSEPEPDSGPEAFKLWFGIKGTTIGTVRHAPVNCIICSRIRFSDEVKQKVRPRIDSLDLWLRYNYPITGGRSYYEILTEGQSELKGLLVPVYDEYFVSEPLAVLYERIYYYHGLEKWFDKVWKSISGGKEGTYELNYLKLVPYTQKRIIEPPVQYGDGSISGGEGCTFVLD